jgi:hypothetical protein
MRSIPKETIPELIEFIKKEVRDILNGNGRKVV